jgi:hypothetical protein
MPVVLRSKWLWIGVCLLVLGTGPLIVAVQIAKLQGDSNPNPVGPGMLCMLTFWPSIGMIVIGLASGLRRQRAQRRA